MLGLSNKQWIFIGVAILVLAIIAYFLLRTPAVVGEGGKPPGDTSVNPGGSKPTSSGAASPKVTDNQTLALAMYDRGVYSRLDGTVALSTTDRSKILKVFKKGEYIGFAPTLRQNNAYIDAGYLLIVKPGGDISHPSYQVKLDKLITH